MVFKIVRSPSFGEFQFVKYVFRIGRLTVSYGPVMRTKRGAHG